MAELSQRDQLALHEFSVRYRAALAMKQQGISPRSLGTIRDTITQQYEQEQIAEREQKTPIGLDKQKQPEDPEP